jgi:hypothetical protein
MAEWIIKDLIPDHYPYGYLLMAMAMKKFGPGFGLQQVRMLSRFKPLFYPLSRAHLNVIQKCHYRQFVKEALTLLPGSMEAPVNDSLTIWANKQKHFLSNAGIVRHG